MSKLGLFNPLHTISINLSFIPDRIFHLDYLHVKKEQESYTIFSVCVADQNYVSTVSLVFH